MSAKFISRIFSVLTLSLYFLRPPAGFSGPNPFLADQGMKLTSLTLHLSPGQGLVLEKIGLSTQSEEIRLPFLTPFLACSYLTS
jgi:hypothetical protein